MISIAHAVTAVALVTGLLVACSTTPPTPEARDELFQRAEAEREEWKKVDPDMEAFVRKQHGFVFFPEITKAGVGFGGGYGRGVVYEQGQHIGYADLTQGSSASSSVGRRTASSSCSRTSTPWIASSGTPWTSGPSPPR